MLPNRLKVQHKLRITDVSLEEHLSCFRDEPANLLVQIFIFVISQFQRLLDCLHDVVYSHCSEAFIKHFLVVLLVHLLQNVVDRSIRSFDTRCLLNRAHEGFEVILNLLLKRAKCVFEEVHHTVKVQLRRKNVKEAVLRVTLEKLGDFVLQLCEEREGATCALKAGDHTSDVGLELHDF